MAVMVEEQLARVERLLAEHGPTGTDELNDKAQLLLKRSLFSYLTESTVADNQGQTSASADTFLRIYQRLKDARDR